MCGSERNLLAVVTRLAFSRSQSVTQPGSFLILRYQFYIQVVRRLTRIKLVTLFSLEFASAADNCSVI
jgi:hypothetical protein